MITVTGVVRSFIRLCETAFEFGPPFINVVAPPNPVIPADVHDTKSDCIPVFNTELIWSHEPVEERLSFSAILRVTDIDHPVDCATFFVLTLATDSAVARDPHSFI